MLITIEKRDSGSSIELFTLPSKHLLANVKCNRETWRESVRVETTMSQVPNK